MPAKRSQEWPGGRTFCYLTKPIKVNELMDALDRVLELVETGLDCAINPGSL